MGHIIYAISVFAKKIQKDKIDLYSGQASLFLIMSCFPFIMVLFCILQYTSIKESFLLQLVHDVIPAIVQPMLITMVNEIYSSSSVTLLSVTAVSAIWVSGKGFVSIMKGLNTVYETGGETRNYFILRLHAIIYTLILIVIIIFILLAMVFGNRMLAFFNANWPFIGKVISFFLNFRVLIFMVLLMIFFTIIYRFVPNRKSKLRYEIPGAIFAGAGWVLFSELFSIYADHSSGFTTTYGSLATLVIIMLWIYTCMMILFIGAEINFFLYHIWQKFGTRYKTNESAQ